MTLHSSVFSESFSEGYGRIKARELTNRIPEVAMNWFNTPKVPEISLGAISSIYNGDTVTNAPMHHPIINLPIKME